MQQETSDPPSGVPTKFGSKLALFFAIAGLFVFTGLSSYLLTQVALEFDASHQSLLSLARADKMQGSYLSCIARAERVLAASPWRKDEARTLLAECTSTQTSNQTRGRVNQSRQLASW